MKLNEAFNRTGRRTLLRLPENKQNTEQNTLESLTPEQTAEALAKRGILMRNPPASTFGVGRGSS